MRLNNKARLRLPRTLALTALFLLSACATQQPVHRRFALSYPEQHASESLVEATTGKETTSSGIGVSYVNAPVNRKFGWELGLQRTSDSGSGTNRLAPLAEVPATTDLDQTELWGGMHIDFEAGSELTPYIGAGVSLIRTEMTTTVAVPGDPRRLNFDSDTFGVYGRAGLIMKLTSYAGLGFDLRYVTLAGLDESSGGTQLDVDLDYAQMTFFLSFSF